MDGNLELSSSVTYPSKRRRSEERLPKQQDAAVTEFEVGVVATYGSDAVLQPAVSNAPQWIGLQEELQTYLELLDWARNTASGSSPLLNRTLAENRRVAWERLPLHDLWNPHKNLESLGFHGDHDACLGSWNLTSGTDKRTSGRVVGALRT